MRLLVKMDENPDEMDEKNQEISLPDKILFPDTGIMKQDLVDYYTRIAGYMLPHIQGRPLTLKRYPEGIGQKGFFNKRAPDYFPEFIQRVSVPLHSEEGKSIRMVMADEKEDLFYFGGQDVIEIHVGSAHATNLEKPDQVIFDLDPSDGDFEKIRQVAMAFREYLDQREITSFIKTTGSRGVHIHIPLRVGKSFSEIKPLSRQVAEQIHQMLPELTTLEIRKEHRGNKVFIDYLRNDYGMTSIAPYSLRALAAAPVATPIGWKELADSDLNAGTYHWSNIFRRLGQKEDPWRNFNRHRIEAYRLV